MTTPMQEEADVQGMRMAVTMTGHGNGDVDEGAQERC